MPCVLEKEAKIVKQIRLILEFFFLACSVTFSNFMFRSCMLCYFIVIYLFIYFVETAKERSESCRGALSSLILVWLQINLYGPRTLVHLQL